MKFTLAEIRWMQKGLSAIVQKQLPIRLSYKLSKLSNFCDQEMASVEKARVDLVKRFASTEKSQNGELRVSAENEDAFRKEFETLLLEEVDVDFKPINLSDLGEDIKISPVEMASLSKVIVENI